MGNGGPGFPDANLRALGVHGRPGFPENELVEFSGVHGREAPSAPERRTRTVGFADTLTSEAHFTCEAHFTRCGRISRLKDISQKNCRGTLAIEQVSLAVCYGFGVNES